MNGISSENPMDQCSIGPTREKRKDSRFLSQSAVMFENYMSGGFNVGQVVNQSRGGMCLRTGARLDLGSEVFIGTEAVASDVFRARVVWLKRSSHDGLYTVGLKFC